MASPVQTHSLISEQTDDEMASPVQTHSLISEQTDDEMASPVQTHSLISALNAKYTEHEAEYCDIYVPKSAPGKTESGNIRVPTQLVLQNFDIDRAGDEAEVRALCGGVQELDLSHNQLSDWNQVFAVLQQMPRVHFVNLSHNPFVNSVIAADYNEQFTNITRLILNNTKVSWEAMNKLLQIMPQLEELHISINEYASVELDQSQHPNIKTLHFNTNQVTEWVELCKLGAAFPNLETFILIENKLCSFCDAEMLSKHFQNLRCMNISQTQLSDWSELEKLNHFPSLMDVRLQKIPLLQGLEEKSRRQMMISYLPRIERLNGSKIGETEREDAERAFIRHFMDDNDKPNRFSELESKYGMLDPLAEVDLRPKVRIYNNGNVESMHIDIHQSISSFKKLLQNITKLPVSKFQLFFFQKMRSKTQPTELTDMKKKLLSVKPIDGDTFYIRCNTDTEIGEDWMEDMAKQPLCKPLWANRKITEPRVLIMVGGKKVCVSTTANPSRPMKQEETESQRRARIMREEVKKQLQTEEKPRKKLETVRKSKTNVTGEVKKTKNVKYANVKSSFIRPKKPVMKQGDFVEIFVGPKKSIKENVQSTDTQSAQNDLDFVTDINYEENNDNKILSTCEQIPKTRDEEIHENMTEHSDIADPECVKINVKDV